MAGLQEAHIIGLSSDRKLPVGSASERIVFQEGLTQGFRFEPFKPTALLLAWEGCDRWEEIG